MKRFLLTVFLALTGLLAQGQVVLNTMCDFNGFFNRYVQDGMTSCKNGDIIYLIIDRGFDSTHTIKLCNQPLSKLIAINYKTGLPLDGFIPPTFSSGAFYDLFFYRNKVYVAGLFDT